MTQSNGENPQRTRSGLQQIRAGIQSRSLLAKKRVENIRKDDVKGFFLRNAFVIFTVAAVIIGKWERKTLVHSIGDSVDLKMEIIGEDFVWSSPLFTPPLFKHVEEGSKFSTLPPTIHQSGVTNTAVAGRKKEKNRNKLTR